jgi:putative membrane protein
VLLHLDFSGLPIVIAAAIGILAGVVIIIKLVKGALAHFRSQTIYAIIGLMLGSLFSVVKGPESLEEPLAAMSLSTFSIPFFIIGGVVILGLQLLKFFISGKKTAETDK